MYFSHTLWIYSTLYFSSHTLLHTQKLCIFLLLLRCCSSSKCISIYRRNGPREFGKISTSISPKVMHLNVKRACMPIFQTYSPQAMCVSEATYAQPNYLIEKLSYALIGLQTLTIACCNFPFGWNMPHVVGPTLGCRLSVSIDCQICQ